MNGSHGARSLNGRDHDDLDQAVVFFDNPQDLEAADTGQADIEQDEIDVFTVENGECRFSRAHFEHAVLSLQDRRQRIPHPFVVVHDEDGLRLLAHRLRADIVEELAYCGRRLTLLQAVR